MLVYHDCDMHAKCSDKKNYKKAEFVSKFSPELWVDPDSSVTSIPLLTSKDALSPAKMLTESANPNKT
jgi:hypothetical protein